MKYNYGQGTKQERYLRRRSDIVVLITLGIVLIVVVTLMLLPNTFIGDHPRAAIYPLAAFIVFVLPFIAWAAGHKRSKKGKNGR